MDTSATIAARPRPSAEPAGNGLVPGRRLVSLDVFRGLTIAAMILVNNPGEWGAVYGPLAHADWHGLTPTDLVFPFFLFIVGTAVPLALGPRLARGEARWRLIRRILGRSLGLAALGLLLAGFPRFDLSTIRIPGVLQRIAVCYLVAAVLFLLTGVRTQIAVAGGLLLGYWMLMTLVPVPGFGAGDLGKEGNLAAYVDRALLGPHLWRASRVYDPEGLLSTLPAIATTITGLLAGRWLRGPRPLGAQARGLAAAGAAATAAGLVWSGWFPVNKSLWTSSYAVLTAGAALLGLATCVWLVDVRGTRKWTAPFLVLGTNAITAFVASTFVARVLALTGLQRWIHAHVFAPWAAPASASLLYATSYLLAWIGLMAVLYRRRLFIRI